MSTGEIILYQTEDGVTKINLREIEGTVWLVQEEIADLFGKGRSTIAEHIQNILNEGELVENSVCRNFRRTAQDGKNYNTLHYNLDMILAVGYRVRSPRGVQFRKWANTVLKEYLVKGFAMNDERLKQADQWDYFDEWLARIRDIRASEKRFYQKVRDLYTTAVDYDKTSEQAQLFFKKVQNKMLWAVTGKTAAELIKNRGDATKPNMGLVAWKGLIVRKGDVAIAKNYLQQGEIENLNRIVTMYLDYAEEQARRRNTINMAQWEEKLDAFLQFNEHDLLTHAGKVKMEVAQSLANERYEAFDAERKKAESLMADAEDLAEIEELVKGLETKSEL
jgi:hypothetical protein